MNSESEARFQRIEKTLDRLAERDRIFDERMDRFDERMNRMAEGHLDLEAGQLNQQKLQAKLQEALTLFIHETRERIDNLTILVDRLVARDLGNGSA